jgi:hypothetical protein
MLQGEIASPWSQNMGTFKVLLLIGESRRLRVMLGGSWGTGNSPDSNGIKIMISVK